MHGICSPLDGVGDHWNPASDANLRPIIINTLKTLSAGHQRRIVVSPVSVEEKSFWTYLALDYPLPDDCLFSIFIFKGQGGLHSGAVAYQLEKGMVKGRQAATEKKKKKKENHPGKSDTRSKGVTQIPWAQNAKEDPRLSFYNWSLYSLWKRN